MKKKFSKEVKIGLAFIVSLFILYYGISFLKGINIFKPTNSYVVVFDDVMDLTLSSPVVINGFQVGLVYSMELDENDPKRVVTVLNLDKGVNINKGSKLSLDVSLLGKATIIIEQNPYTKEYYSSDDTIVGLRPSGMFDALSKDVLPQFTAMIPKIDSILGGVQTIVNHPALTQSLSNIEQITKDMEASSRQLNALLVAMNKDVPKITSNMASVSSDVAGVSSQFKSMNLVGTFNSIDSTLKNVHDLTAKMKARDNSLGLLLNDRQLYDSLTNTMGNASLLLKDVKENPQRYINIKVF